MFRKKATFCTSRGYLLFADLCIIYPPEINVLFSIVESNIWTYKGFASRIGSNEIMVDSFT